MGSVAGAEADQEVSTIAVGRDAAGRWLVQERRGRLEGRFVSLSAAMAFARSERHAFPGAVIVIESRVLTAFLPCLRCPPRAAPVTTCFDRPDAKAG